MYSLQRLQQAYQQELGGCRHLVPTQKERVSIRKFKLNIRLQSNPDPGMLQVGEIILINGMVWKITEIFDCDGRAGYMIETAKNNGMVYADELEEENTHA